MPASMAPRKLGKPLQPPTNVATPTFFVSSPAKSKEAAPAAESERTPGLAPLNISFVGDLADGVAGKAG